MSTYLCGMKRLRESEWKRKPHAPSPNPNPNPKHSPTLKYQHITFR